MRTKYGACSKFPKSPFHRNIKVYSKKIEKKKTRLKEKIATMELELLEALTKKTSTTKEINVPSYTREIQELKLELQNLK